MEFAGLIKQSLVDYPGEVAAVLFTRGCNFLCPFCHNAQLVVSQRLKTDAAGPKIEAGKLELETVLDFLKERKGFLDGVVITGGEPTIQAELPEVLARFKEIGYLVKLDTNGTNPSMLEGLLREGLLDYVAMDVKAPLDYKSYAQAVGKLSAENFLHIKSSINLLRNAVIKVEFRTTVVPVLHTPEDIAAIAKYLEECDLYTLQQFNPACTLDPNYSQVTPYSQPEMQEIANQCAAYVAAVRVINI